MTCYASTAAEDDPAVDSGTNLALNVATDEDAGTEAVTVTVD